MGATVKKRIDEISLMKGTGILIVMLLHVRLVSDSLSDSKMISDLVQSISLPLMLMFFSLAGYTSRVKKDGALKVLVSRAKHILIPYYLYSMIMLLIYAVIYLGIEKRTFAWYADGAAGILLQLQSFHFFDTSSQGVHLMFYGGLVGWFIFQMVVSEALFLPILYAVKEKGDIWKAGIATLLLMAGAILYLPNLQGLNGEYFPAVCKIFILPNIPGIAGLMMIGNIMGDLKVLELDRYSGRQKALIAGISFAVMILFFLTDDYIYDFPIGKWGPYGAFSYFLAPVYGAAFFMFLAILCHCLKRILPVKRFLVYLGDNSMDYLMIHFFIIFLTSYIGGFWYNFLHDPAPDFNRKFRFFHFLILLGAVFAVCHTVIAGKKHIRNLMEKK